VLPYADLADAVLAVRIADFVMAITAGDCDSDHKISPRERAVPCRTGERPLAEHASSALRVHRIRWGRAQTRRHTINNHHAAFAHGGQSNADRTLL
jgi:hypothetical protein